MTEKTKQTLVPLGHRILVKPDPIENETDWGLKIVQDEKLARYNVQVGTLVSIGPDAWKAFRKVDDNGKEVNGQAWARVGDRVWYARQAGKLVKHPETGEDFLIMNDEDVSLRLLVEEV